MSIKILAPMHTSVTKTQFKEHFDHSSFQTKPFENKLLNFLSLLSSNIIKRRESKMMPELMALGFWLRKSNLEKIKVEFVSQSKNSVIKKPRGIVFHVAPKNVDTIFIYSWALSFLSGNHNIVRISSAGSKLIDIILEEISALAKFEGFSFVKHTQTFLTYTKNDDINSFFSQIANVRMIWGGDETISIFKKLKTKPNTKDLCFSNKESIACIDSSAYNQLDVKTSSKIAEKFYNDSYWFEQMACSSPKYIFFIGPNRENILCSSIFEKCLNAVINEKGYYADITSNIGKLKNIFYAASKKDYLKSDRPPVFNKATFVNLNSKHFLNGNLKCHSGTFGKLHIENIYILEDLLKDNFQTLSYYGFSNLELNKFIDSNTKISIDRVVPIGQALDFDKTWDSYDLLGELVRHVSVV
ncbi:hypothetical protein N9P26_01520 [Amylibacter sp.]|nr:hypothetical protein [Amylibacter sp.]